MFEEFKKAQRGGSTPGFGGGLRIPLLHIRDPKARIGCLVLALFVIVGAMVGLHNFAQRPESDRIVEEPPTVPVTDFAEEFSGVPSLDMAKAEGIADREPESRRRWPRDVMPYLLFEAANTPAIHAYHKNHFPLTADSAAEIAKDSAPWRFKFVRFRGDLEAIQEQDYEETYGPSEYEIGRVHRGRVRTEDGVDIGFVTPTIPMWKDPNSPEPVPELRMLADGYVRGGCILVQNFVDEDCAETLLVVATELTRDYRTATVASLDDVPFDLIEDDPGKLAGTSRGRAVLAKDYPRALYRLVRYAEERAGPEGAEKRKAEGLKPRSVATDKEWNAILGEPAKHRGQYFGGLGAIAMEPLLLGPESIEANDAGIDECVAGWILTDERKVIQFVAPASLGADWKRKDRIRWEGYFYKTKLYPTRAGTDNLTHLFVLTVLETVPLPEPDYALQFTIAGAFALGIIALFVLVLREDKTKDSYRALQRKRRQEAAAKAP